MIKYTDELVGNMLTVLKPVKVKSNWILDIKYDDKPLFFQTPKIYTGKGCIECPFGSKLNGLLTFLDSVEKHIITYLKNHSIELFNKEFTEDKVRDSLTSNMLIDDDRGLFLYTVYDKANFYDFLGKKVDALEVGTKSQCIVQVSRLIFTRTQFKVEYNVVSVKECKPENKSVSYFEVEEDLKKLQITEDCEKSQKEEKHQQSEDTFF